MLLPRITPCLLVHKRGLVKTVRFENPKYVGDPLNAVRIYNEKEVDELVVVDIDASVENREPNYELIANLAKECRMPLCYGGGVRTPGQIEKIVSLGVEKVALGHSVVERPKLIKEASERVGNQSIVVVLDIKKVGVFSKKYRLFTLNGKRESAHDMLDFVAKASEYGAGELLVNSIDRDGTCMGYDMELVETVRRATKLPITALGGAGDYAHMSDLFKNFGIMGAGAGSLFVFKGKYKAVLIQYPEKPEKKEIFTSITG